MGLCQHLFPFTPVATEGISQRALNVYSFFPEALISIVGALEGLGESAQQMMAEGMGVNLIPQEVQKMRPGRGQIFGDTPILGWDL